MDAMSCLAPQPASFLPTAASPAYYTDAAIARALRYSISDHYNYSPAASSSTSPTSSSSLLADLHFSGGTNWFTSTAPAPTAAPPTGLTCDSVLVSSDAAPRTLVSPVTQGAAPNKKRVGLGPAGRAGKRRPRASKRAPTTYISTDPSNFRLMVQHVTGVQAQPAGGDDVLQLPASFDASSAVAAGLLDRHPAFDGASFGDALSMPSSDGDAAAALQHRLQQQQQPCYPTLDSWSVMYESGELL